MRMKTQDAIRMLCHFLGTLNASPITVEGASGRRTFPPGQLIVVEIPTTRCADDPSMYEYHLFIVRPANPTEQDYFEKAEWPIEAEIVWERL